MVGDEPAWFFYEDQAPYQSYAHAGRVVLVGTETGKVTVTKTLQWPPVIAGRLPAFLRSADAYRDTRYRALIGRGRRARQAPPPRPRLRRPAHRSRPPPHASRPPTSSPPSTRAPCGSATRSATSTTPPRSTRAVRASRSCSTRSRLSPGFISKRYRFATVRGGESLKSFISKLLTKRGCKDLMIYVAGGGYVTRGESVINVGTRVRRDGRVEQQTVTAGALRAILREHPGVTFKVMLDAPTRAASGQSCVMRRTCSSSSFGIGDARQLHGAARGARPARPPGAQQLQQGAAAGVLQPPAHRDVLLRRQPERGRRGRAPKADGTSKSFLAWMLARAFSLCSAGSVLSTVEGGPKPVITLPGSGVGSPAAPAPAAPSTPAVPGTPTTPLPLGNDTPALFAPAVSLTGGALGYTENDPATVVDAGLTVSDADSASLSGATVSIATGFAAGQDVLGSRAPTRPGSPRPTTRAPARSR